MKRFRECVCYGALTLGLAAAPVFAQTSSQPGTATPDTTTMSDRTGTAKDNINYRDNRGSRHSFGWLGLLGLIGLGGLMKRDRMGDRSTYTRPEDRPTMRP